MFIVEILQYDFMIHALVVGFFTAISTAILGNFIVAARQAVISDMLAHTALVGVGLGIFWKISPTYFAILATFISAVLLWALSRKKNQAPEAISMVLLTGGLATALLFTHLNKDNPVSLDTYLFGSILTITPAEMWSFIVLNIFVIGIVVVFWRSFMTLAFDKKFLQIYPYSRAYEILFMLLIALIVSVGLKVIGGLLIGALLVIPVLIAQSLSRSFFQNVLWSIIVNIFAISVGIFASFYLDIPASSGIVLSLIFLYFFLKTKDFIFQKY